jgi:hypothetical protein
MLYRALALILIARLVLAPWAGAEIPASTSPTPGPIAASAARQAQDAARADPLPPMHRGLKWTGIALVIAGGATALSAAIGNCGRACRSNDTVLGVIVGASEAATGVALLGIADARRRKGVPTVAVADGRLLLQHRVTF